MKRIYILIIFIIISLSLITTAFAASVTPVEYPGNDANSYTPPEGCIRTTLPESNVIGIHEYIFNEFGQLDPTGTNILTLEIGITPPAEYTKVLSWSWSGTYPLFAIIVKGGNAFNLYVYDGTATSDTDLVSPVNDSGQPASISHVSVVLCPEETPPVPPDGEVTCCCIIIIVLLVIIIGLLVAVLVTLINIKCLICYKKHPCFDHDC